MIVALSFLQPSNRQQNTSISPPEPFPVRFISFARDEPVRIDSGMKQSDALVGKAPILFEDSFRIAAIGNYKLGSTKNAPGQPSQLPASGGQVYFLAVHVTQVGNTREPMKDPGQQSFRETSTAMKHCYAV
jgi:hypothetical protein